MLTKILKIVLKKSNFDTEKSTEKLKFGSMICKNRRRSGRQKKILRWIDGCVEKPVLR